MRVIKFKSEGDWSLILLIFFSEDGFRSAFAVNAKEGIVLDDKLHNYTRCISYTVRLCYTVNINLYL